MATDNTHLPQTDDAGTSMAQEFNPEVVQLAQADTATPGAPAGTQTPVIPGAPNGEVKVEVPAGQTVVRVQVAPGETIDLPFDGALAAKIGQQGNLAIKSGDQTIILIGYGAANQQTGVTLHDHKGHTIDVATVVAQTDPNLDIQTAAGPAAGPAGGQGGHLFFGFSPNGGLGGLGELGVIAPTELQYKLIQPDEQIFLVAPTDTTPQLVNVTTPNVVNEDDFQISHGIEEAAVVHNNGETGAILNPDLQSQIESSPIFGNVFYGTFLNHDQGNDSHDTTDHEEGSQNGSNADNNGDPTTPLDLDREPLTTKSQVTVNFFNDVPGKILLENGGVSPTIDALVAMNLTSHGLPLHYALLPETATHGQSIVAYIDLADAPSFQGESQRDGESAQVLIFAIEVEQPQGNTAISNFNIDFTIFGTIDNPFTADDPNATDGGVGTGVLNLDTVFFIRDSNGTTVQVPSHTLVFHDYDDVPALGRVVYDNNDNVTGLIPANLTLGIDEHGSLSGAPYQADLNNIDPNHSSDPAHSNHQVADQSTDNLNPNSFNIDNANGIILTALNHAPSDGGSYADGILGLIDNSFFKNGDPHQGFASMLGAAQNDPNYFQSTNTLAVDFGADGQSFGDKAQFGVTGKAGPTLFDKDNPTDIAHGFELYMQDKAAKGAPVDTNHDGVADSNLPVDQALTNLTISVEMNDGSVAHQAVKAYQLDAYTIIGIADGLGEQLPGGGDGPAEFAVAEGPVYGGGGIPVFALHLNPDTGQLTLIQYHQVDNLDTGGNPTDFTHLLNSDGSQLLHFRATDFDGDHIDAPLEVTFVDDVPHALDDKAVLDETLAPGNDIDGDPHKVTGNVILGISNDGLNNDNAGDYLSLDHNHTIPQLKYGNSTIDLDLTDPTNPGITKSGTDASNVQYHWDGTTGVLSFDTHRGHFEIVVKTTDADPSNPGQSTDKTQLGYYVFTGAHNADDHYFGVPQDGNGNSQLPPNGTTAEKITWLLNSFAGVDLTNNHGGIGTDPAHWGTKTVTVDGHTYTGLGVGGGLDDGETDTNAPHTAEQLTINLKGGFENATVTLGAFFDGQFFDQGHVEVARWEALAADGVTVIASGEVLGVKDGLLDVHIETNQEFQYIRLTPLDDGAGNNNANSDFLLVGVNTCKPTDAHEVINYTLQDADKDQSSANLDIGFVDGKPIIDHERSTACVTLDEDGLTNGHGVPPEAHSLGNVFAYTGGPDGFESLTLNAIVNPAQPIQTLAGKDVIFAWDAPNHQLVGYEAGNTAHKVLTIVLSPANGTDYSEGFKYDVNLLEPLKHPGSGEDKLAFDVSVQIEDQDCSVTSGCIHVKVIDDTPVAYVQTSEYEVIEDETPGVQPGSNDQNGPDPFAAESFGTLIGWAKGGHIIDTHLSSFGADGPAASNAITYALSPFSAGIACGLKDTATQSDILLYQDGDLVVGRVGGPNGAIALAYGIDAATGEITLAQYLAIYHGNPNNPDDYAFLNDNVLMATVTLTDADGDKASQAVDVGNHTAIKDDGPVAHDDSNSVFGSSDHLHADGNVITGVGEAAGGADVPGTDGAHVDAAKAAGALTSTVVDPGAGGTVINGIYGDLTIHQDGSYTYAQHSPAPDNVATETFNYTLKDGDGDPANATLDITVSHAPQIELTTGDEPVPVIAEILNLSLPNNPDGSASVGDYLLNTSIEGHAINPALVNGVDPANLHMNFTADVQVTFEREGAGAHNMVGVYNYDSGGNIIPGSVKFLWLDASQTVQDVLHNALVTDPLGNAQPMNIDLGNLPAGTNLGFFLLVDAANNPSTVQTLLNVAGGGGHGYATDLAAINAVTSISVDGNGHGHVVVNGTQLAGDALFTSDENLNTYDDGQTHALSGVSTPPDGNLYVGFEDRKIGGNVKPSDKDYNDIVFGVNLGAQNQQHFTPAVFSPNVNLGDQDNDIIRVDLVTTGFLAGDALLNAVSNSEFIVVDTPNGDNHTVTITEVHPETHTGAQWQAFVNSIGFASSSQVDGERDLKYTVTDVSNNHAETTAKIDLVVQHDESLSLTALEHHNATPGTDVTWSKGDDTLYLDKNFTATDGHLDMGGGFNSVQIGANGENFTGADASHFSNVHGINATGFGANSVILNINDILPMIGGDHKLQIDGDAGIDKVNLDGNGGALGNWHQEADVNIGGKTYNEYQWHSAGGVTQADVLATVLVDHNLIQTINDKA